MNMLKSHWLIATVVVLAIAVFAAFQFKGNDKPQYFTAKVDRGDIRSVVEATGTINAVTTVQVGPQVLGTISRLNADFNSRVKKGQVVAQIDPSLFEGTLLQAKADLANAKANVVASQANLEKAQAIARQTRADSNSVHEVRSPGSEVRGRTSEVRVTSTFVECTPASTITVNAAGWRGHPKGAGGDESSVACLPSPFPSSQRTRPK